MNTIYPSKDPSDSTAIRGYKIANRVYRELTIEQRAPSLIGCDSSDLPVSERERIIRETFSEEELVRVADQMREMYQPPVGFLERVSSWWNRVVLFF